MFVCHSDSNYWQGFPNIAEDSGGDRFGYSHNITMTII